MYEQQVRAAWLYVCTLSQLTGRRSLQQPDTDRRHVLGKIHRSEASSVQIT